jgi:3D (Asp-Asp-Asp) domain-containing protein
VDRPVCDTHPPWFARHCRIGARGEAPRTVPRLVPLKISIMLLTRSLKQKIAATCGAMFGFVLLYEVTMLDSKTTEARTIEIRETTAKPAPGLRLRFTSTAYCKGTTTASGAAVRAGIAAADPDLLPVGSVIQIESLGAKYNGIYTVMDTGPKVQGRHVDLYIWSCHEALAFGRRPISLNVLRLGWNPRASSVASIGPMFKQRERDMVANDAAVAAGLAAAREAAATTTTTAAPDAGVVPAAPVPIAPASVPAPSSAPSSGATGATSASPTQTSPVSAVARRSS